MSQRRGGCHFSSGRDRFWFLRGDSFSFSERRGRREARFPPPPRRWSGRAGIRRAAQVIKSRARCGLLSRSQDARAAPGQPLGSEAWKSLLGISNGSEEPKGCWVFAPHHLLLPHRLWWRRFLRGSSCRGRALVSVAVRGLVLVGETAFLTGG